MDDFDKIVHSLRDDLGFEHRNFERFEILEIVAMMNDLSAFFTRLIAHTYMMDESILALNDETEELLQQGKDALIEMHDHFLGECECEFCQCDCDPLDPCDDCLDRLEEYADEEDEL